MKTVREFERKQSIYPYPSCSQPQETYIRMRSKRLPKNPYEARVVDDENKTQSHAADPLMSKDKINRIIAKSYENGDYCKITRFILGINTGFRDSDLRNIKVKDIFKPDGTVKDFYSAYEVKTQDTRKIPKPRVCYLNDTVKKALEFLVSVKEKRPQDYLFTADKQNHRRKYIEGFYTNEDSKTVAIKTEEQFSDDGTEYLEAYMETGEYGRYLKKLAKSLGMDEHCSTHCQRQTYGYWLLNKKSKWEVDNDIDINVKDAELLRLAFGHSSLNTTLAHYARLPARAVKERELEMNLGKEAVDNFVDNFPRKNNLRQPEVKSN